MTLLETEKRRGGLIGRSDGRRRRPRSRRRYRGKFVLWGVVEYLELERMRGGSGAWIRDRGL